MALTNSYLQGVYETVQKRNPNEPEFQQAVYEVLESLSRLLKLVRSSRRTASWSAS